VLFVVVYVYEGEGSYRVCVFVFVYSYSIHSIWRMIAFSVAFCIQLNGAVVNSIVFLITLSS
jgi:hypothetical protein